jgi:hypothetical protein
MPLRTQSSLSTWTPTDPPKVLFIGPRSDGQLLEVIVPLLANQRELVIHAMELRPTFHDLLPKGDF